MRPAMGLELILIREAFQLSTKGRASPSCLWGPSQPGASIEAGTSPTTCRLLEAAEISQQVSGLFMGLN